MPIILIYINKFLYSIPAIATTPIFLNILGKDFWTSLVSAQIIGGMFAVLIEANWRTIGIRELTKTSKFNLIRVTSKNITQRISLFLITLPLLMILSMTLPSSDKLLIFLSSVASASLSLSIDSFFVSRNNFSYIYWIEPLSKLFINLFPLFYVSSHTEMKYYFAVVILSNMLVPISILKGSKNYNFQKSDLKLEFRIYKYSVSKLLATSYTIFPIPIMLYFNLNNLFIYAATDKLYRYVMTFYLPLIQYAQQRIHNQIVYVAQWTKIVYFGLITIPISYAGMELLKGFNIVPKNYAPFSLMIYFVILSSVVNINRLLEIIITEKTSSNESNNIIYALSTFLFWLLFIFCIYFQSYTICILSCLVSEIFACMFRLFRILSFDQKIKD